MKVLVLGAGVIGTTSAWFLSQAGHEVTVVDRHAEAAMETSYANGGQISAGHAEPWAKPELLPKLAGWLGREDAPLLFRLRADPAQWAWGLGFLAECLPGRFERNCRRLAGLARYSRGRLQALREATGIEYDQLARGILHFCSTRQDFDALARHAEAMRALGIRREVKTAAQCVALEPALAASTVPIAGGVYTPEDESGDARKFTQALAALARQRGVQFRAGTVRRLHVAASRVDGVEVGEEILKSDAYVVALGSYSPLLLRPIGLTIPVFPLKGYSVTFHLGAEAAAAPMVSLTDEGLKIVISRLGERLRAAGTAELTGYDTSVNEVRCKAIAERVRALFPALRAVPDSEHWAGLRPATPDNVPIIGRTRYGNLYLNTGHGTLGWTLSCGSANVLADIVSGRCPEIDLAG